MGTASNHIKLLTLVSHCGGRCLINHSRLHHSLSATQVGKKIWPDQLEKLKHKVLLAQKMLGAK